MLSLVQLDEHAQGLDGSIVSFFCRCAKAADAYVAFGLIRCTPEGRRTICQVVASPAGEVAFGLASMPKRETRPVVGACHPHSSAPNTNPARPSTVSTAAMPAPFRATGHRFVVIFVLMAVLAVWNRACSDVWVGSPQDASCPCRRAGHRCSLG